MNTPYKGKFKVTQIKHSAHDGLDLVGLDSKEIHATVSGIVERAGWENPNDHGQGFGQYVRIKDDKSEDRYYFGHMSKVKVKLGQKVKAGSVIGIEGSTGRSTGSHCHYCVRGHASKAEVKDVNAISGIPNKEGIYDSGVKQTQQKPVTKKSGITLLKTGSWNVRNASSLGASVNRVVRGVQTVTYVDIVPETNPEKYGKRDFYKLRDGTFISVKACK